MNKNEVSISKKFLSEHKNADELIYDAETKLPICAIYLNLGYFTMNEKAALLKKMAKLIIKNGRDG